MKFHFSLFPARWGQRVLPMTYRTLLERFVLKPPQEISSFMPKPNRGAVMPSIWRFFSLRRSPPFQRPNRFFSDEL